MPCDLRGKLVNKFCFYKVGGTKRFLQKKKTWIKFIHVNYTSKMLQIVIICYIFDVLWHQSVESFAGVCQKCHSVGVKDHGRHRKQLTSKAQWSLKSGATRSSEIIMPSPGRFSVKKNIHTYCCLPGSTGFLSGSVWNIQEYCGKVLN